MKSFRQYISETNTKRIERVGRAVLLKHGEDSPEYRRVRLLRKKASDSAYERGADTELPIKKETPRQRDYWRKLARREAGEPETRSGLLPSTVYSLKQRLQQFKTQRQAGKEPKY